MAVAAKSVASFFMNVSPVSFRTGFLPARLRRMDDISFQKAIRLRRIIFQKVKATQRPVTNKTKSDKIRWAGGSTHSVLEKAGLWRFPAFSQPR
jgi:hypothetical protein